MMCVNISTIILRVAATVEMFPIWCTGGLKIMTIGFIDKKLKG